MAAGIEGQGGGACALGVVHVFPSGAEAAGGVDNQSGHIPIGCAAKCMIRRIGSGSCEGAIMDIEIRAMSAVCVANKRALTVVSIGSCYGPDSGMGGDVENRIIERGRQAEGRAVCVIC